MQIRFYPPESIQTLQESYDLFEHMFKGSSITSYNPINHCISYRAAKRSHKSRCEVVASEAPDINWVKDGHKQVCIQRRELIFNEFNHDVNRAACDCCGSSLSAEYNVEWFDLEDRKIHDRFRCCRTCIKRWMPRPD